MRTLPTVMKEEEVNQSGWSSRRQARSASVTFLWNSSFGVGANTGANCGAAIGGAGHERAAISGARSDYWGGYDEFYTAFLTHSIAHSLNLEPMGPRLRLRQTPHSRQRRVLRPRVTCPLVAGTRADD